MLRCRMLQGTEDRVMYVVLGAASACCGMRATCEALVTTKEIYPDVCILADTPPFNRHIGDSERFYFTQLLSISLRGA